MRLRRSTAGARGKERGFEEGRDEKPSVMMAILLIEIASSSLVSPSILGLSPGERLERIRDSRVELSPASCRTAGSHVDWAAVAFIARRTCF